MAITDSALLDVLKTVTDPNTGRDFVSTRQIKNLKIDGDDVAFDVELGYPAKSQIPALRKSLVAAARTVPGVGNVSINLATKVIAHAVQRGVQLLPKVKNIVAVASGKGGVGKSTTAVNLALALAAEGAAVGILDADIYGPSQPMMMGIEGRPESADGKTMEPLENYGVQVISIGFLIDADNPDDLARPRWPRRRWSNCCARPTGPNSTTSSSTCRRAPATSRSRSASVCR